MCILIQIYCNCDRFKSCFLVHWIVFIVCIHTYIYIYLYYFNLGYLNFCLRRTGSIDYTQLTYGIKSFAKINKRVEYNAFPLIRLEIVFNALSKGA